MVNGWMLVQDSVKPKETVHTYELDSRDAPRGKPRKESPILAAHSVPI
jgi:hypothetical protein